MFWEEFLTLFQKKMISLEVIEMYFIKYIQNYFVRIQDLRFYIQVFFIRFIIEINSDGDGFQNDWVNGQVKRDIVERKVKVYVLVKS